jgi:TPR repeat protein
MPPHNHRLSYGLTRGIALLLVLGSGGCVTAPAPEPMVCAGLDECRMADPCVDIRRAGVMAGKVPFADRPAMAVAFDHACQGSTMGAFLMADAFDHGSGGVRHNDDLAARFYRLAATPPAAPKPGMPLPPKEPPLAEAAYRLGLMHWEGRGVPQDLDAARIWLSRAANAGHEQAKLALKGLISADAPSPP